MYDIIPMKPEHLDMVLEIEKQSYTMPWSKNDYITELIKTESIYFVAVENGAVIGYIGMWHIINEGHITTVAVSPQKRKSGVGAALLHKLTETAEQLEMVGLLLEVRVNNYAAQRLYLKNGFILERIRKNYYSDTGEDALILWKNLGTENNDRIEIYTT